MKKLSLREHSSFPNFYLTAINLIFTNFYGLWALIGIPAVLIIHFLQRRAKVEIVSTLFLLHQTQRESTSGRRFDRLVHSIPLWLQILIVLLVTWLLVQPKYIKAKSTQRIAIVLDSSASMRVFKKKIPEVLQREISRLQGNAANIEIWLIESDPSKTKIYQGTSKEDMLLALENWQPSSGATDFSNTLRVARSLVGAEGAISYITDITPQSPAPYNSSSIAIGAPSDNCGFTGVTFEKNSKDLIWKAIVRNYSNTEQTRTWHLETATGKSSSKSITLAAGSLTTLQGVFPANQSRCRLQLSGDAFDLDDTLPLVRPAPKPLIITSNLPQEIAKLGERITASFPNLKAVTANADLVITSTDTTPKEQHLIVFPQDKVKNRPYLTGNIVATKHHLTQGLNWQTLLARNSISIPHDHEDEVLLWQGDRALIFLRTHPQSKNKALIFNFDIYQSNGMKQPALVILMLRFCEQLRSEKIAPETKLTETSEPLSFSYQSAQDAPPLIYTTTSLDGQIISSKSTRGDDITAPGTPGFFTIQQGEQALLSSATYFADTREADFSECSTGEILASNLATAVDRHTHDDHLWRVWACLILVTLLLAWHFTRSRKVSSPQKQRR